jgi:hypothetical protein
VHSSNLGFGFLFLYALRYGLEAALGRMVWSNLGDIAQAAVE